MESNFANATAGTTDQANPRLSTLLPQYLRYAECEWGLSCQTARSYHYGLRLIMRIVGDLPVSSIRKEHLVYVKAKVAAQGAGPAHIKRIVNSLKSLLKFCRAADIPALDPRELKAPRIPKREVVFLNAAEVEEFVSAIPFEQEAKWLCFRALVEVLLGSGMRISEALSLKRSSVNFHSGEARIIGKGNKTRTVFFTARALHWLSRFLDQRTDETDAMFTLSNGQPFGYSVVSKWFRGIQARAKLGKQVTAHILRHTVATTLLFNGCPIGHIKEVLGHSYLQTTCMYYLGTDKVAAKEAQLRYLDYGSISP
jgi:integrase/recombinase XerD